MSLDTIEKKIENLRKLKAVLKGKMDRVDFQIQKEKSLKENEKLRLKHIKSQKTFFKN